MYVHMDDGLIIYDRSVMPRTDALKIDFILHVAADARVDVGFDVHDRQADKSLANIIGYCIRRSPRP